MWGAIRSVPGASPPHLSCRARRDEYGARIGKGQTKYDQGRKALLESLSTPPSRAGTVTSDGKKSTAVDAPCFSLIDGN